MLLEAVIAIAILAVAGTSAAWLAADSVRLVNRAHQTEATVLRAERLLDAVLLWPREDLDRHLGESTQGEFRLVVHRDSRRLYHAAVRDTVRQEVLLRTSLYRGDAESEGEATRGSTGE